MDDGYMVLTFEAWARLGASVKVEGGKVLIPRTVWEESGSGVHEKKQRKSVRADEAMKARVAKLAEENPRLTYAKIEKILGVYPGYFKNHPELSSIVQAARMYRSRRQVEESGDCARDGD